MPSKALTRAIATGPDLSGYATTAALTTATASSAPSGKIAYVAQAFAPSGWLLADGKTIGSASSGATGRAAADAAALFAVMWALDASAYPITTSAGAASTRGASAAADFSANKRLPLPDLRGEFLRGHDGGRGVDGGRVLASNQAEMIGPHTHPVPDAESSAAAAAGSSPSPSSNQSTKVAVVTSPNAGTENRPRNVAMTGIIKL